MSPPQKVDVSQRTLRSSSSARVEKRRAGSDECDGGELNMAVASPAANLPELLSLFSTSVGTVAVRLGDGLRSPSGASSVSF